MFIIVLISKYIYPTFWLPHCDSFETKMMAVIILCVHPANERWRYNVTSSLIGWGRIQNYPCDSILNFIDPG